MGVKGDPAYFDVNVIEQADGSVKLVGIVEGAQALCGWCGIEFVAQPGPRKYCNYQCRWVARIARQHPKFGIERPVRAKA
jgi:hypothetical protein